MIELSCSELEGVIQFHNSSRGLIETMDVIGDMRDAENPTVFRRFNM